MDSRATSRLIQAVRVGYQVAWVLPIESAVDHVRNIRAAWETGDKQDVLSALHCLRYELSQTPDTSSAWSKLSEAILSVDPSVLPLAA